MIIVLSGDTSMRAHGLVQTSCFSEKRNLVSAYFENNAMNLYTQMIQLSFLFGEDDKYHQN